MADYDVGIIGLTSPPSLSVLQTYRPAVATRNNGIHDALASGVLRIYSAGLLVFTSELYSAVIPPGETRDALAVGYWTPTEGTYTIIADCTCPLDQVESNNHLGPTQIVVSGEAPPPPPSVPFHASQHEEGMSDELIVDGLHGRLADAQLALGHKASHMVGGSDLLNVDGLAGTLATPQPIAWHRESHEDHGSDEIKVDGLTGVLYNLQKPQVHANEKHDPNFATSTELSNHLDDTTAVHAVATNLEQVSRKGDPNGYPELDSLGHVPPDQLAPVAATSPDDVLSLDVLGGAVWKPAIPAEHGSDKHDDTVASRTGVDKLIPGNQLAPTLPLPPPDYVLRADQTWGPGGGAAVAHHETHEDAGDDEISIAGLSGKAADAQDPTEHGNAAHSTAFEDSAAKGAANGYAPLGADSLVPPEYLPEVPPAQNATYTKLALNSLQVVDELGDTLVFGALNTGTALKPNHCMRVIITGYVDPHADSTFLELHGKMSQGLVDTWLSSATLAFPASPANGQYFKYEARLYFRLDSVTTFNSLLNGPNQCYTGDNGDAWDEDVFTSWQFFAHLGLPLLTVHIFSRQAIIEPYTP